MTASSNGVHQASEGRDALGVRVALHAIFLFRDFPPCTGLEPATRWLTAYWKPDVFIGFCCLGKDFSGAIGPEIDGDPSRRRFTLSCTG